MRGGAIERGAGPGLGVGGTSAKHNHGWVARGVYDSEVREKGQCWSPIVWIAPLTAGRGGALHHDCTPTGAKSDDLSLFFQ